MQKIYSLLAVFLLFLPSIALVINISIYKTLKLEIVSAIGLSICAYNLVSWMIPTIKQTTLRAGLFGKDLCKRGTSTADKKIPEALGIVPGVVFMIVVIVLQTVYGSTPERLVEYNSCLLSISFMMFLGFADDVLSLRWRYKFVLPFIASLPLLCSYFSEGGVTYVLIPKPLRFIVTEEITNITEGLPSSYELTAIGSIINIVFHINGNILNLGAFYYIYMSCIAIFTTNAINIYAGINGLEVGQSLVIGVSILTMNLYEIMIGPEESVHVENHIFSAVIMIPFVGVTLGLLKYNWFPARVFVGDTYCYFAGMTFGVVAILGHFSKSLLLLFLPQLFNFLYSIPQLLPSSTPISVPCPRHRLPHYNSESGLIEPSIIPDNLFSASRSRNKTSNLTLINLFLRMFGPQKEERLTLYLLILQVVACVIGLFIRYHLVHLIF